MPINVKSLSFKSANGVDIVCGAVYYSDNAPVKAIVLVNHGMCEHIGRYHEFMLFLARHGYAAFGHDHLGHGKTAPNAERLGYFASERGHICLVRDAHQMCQIAKNMFPGPPVFLLGHSMGSLVARLYCVKFPDSIQGTMFLGTPGPNPMTGLGLLMAQKVKRREGEFYRSERLNEMTLGKMNKRFSPTRTTHDWLTRDEQAVDK